MIEVLYKNIDAISYGLAIIILVSPLRLKKRFGKGHIASLTITIGILGTFFGVFLGLLNFDPNDINGSVPALIRGLQTAFITSIAGLLSNLVLRIYPSIYGLKEERVGKKSDDIAEQMIESMNRVANSISGDGDSTMVTQLQKIRTTNADGFDVMIKSFNEFAQKMVADNTQSLIDALTEVMKDFNAKINEQFGENFKQLNEAVKAMLEWQKEYKEHVENLLQKFNNMEKAMQGVDKSLASTAKSNKTIEETNRILNEVIKEFSETAGSLSGIGESAKTNFPIIQESMEKLSESAEEYVEKSLKHIKDDYKNFEASQKEISDKQNEVIQKMITDSAERIKTLDEQLGIELNKSITSLGNQLTSLSSHFVEDYKPLTEKLKKILDISRDLN